MTTRGIEARRGETEGLDGNRESPSAASGAPNSPNSTIPIVKPGGEIPEGWIAHDGGQCPVALSSKPGVMFEGGLRYEAGEMKAATWGTMGFGKPDLWKHEDPGMRIIAYKPSDDSGGI